MRTRRGIAVAVVVALAVGLLVACNGSYKPPTDCQNWRYGPNDTPAAGVLPTEFNYDSSWKLTSKRDNTGGLSLSPQNHCGQEGAAADLAWGVNQGRDDVTIAVLDSGIEWRNQGAMADLAKKVHINCAEAKPAGSPANCDTNHDGVFNIDDFGAIPDRNGNGIADPEDLILDPAYNNGVDDDHNGYVDDIAGWDFLYGDNDPLDTVNYGHGTGEARDSTAQPNNGGDVGTCPQCRVLPVRVGDSFIADGGRFAAGVLFALDSGVDVVQEALGAISAPRQAQQAIDAAYNRGVVVVASMADEASKHPNLPAALEHTMPVNSVTTLEFPGDSGPAGYLALNGCTNWGGITWVSVESASCSSEATGLSAGMVGLLESTARAAGLPRNPANAGPADGNPLSANEAMQVVRANADDIDFGTPNSVDPANNYNTDKGDILFGLINTDRYPTRKGWDAVTGYGRLNAYEVVKAVKDKRIPPEADMTSPMRFDVKRTSGSLAVKGRVASRFSDSYDYRVEWAAGYQPPQYPATDTWHVASEQTGLTSPKSGTLGTIDLAAVAAALPENGNGVPVGSDGRPDEEKYSVRVRVVATAHGSTADGLTGIMQKQIFVHNDPDLKVGYPKRVDGASASSPVFANLDGQPGDELLVATADGYVHAYKNDGSELPGWPVHTAVAPWWPTNSPTAAADGISPMHSGIMIGAPSVDDIDKNGTPDVVVTDLDGSIWAWNAAGQLLPGFAETTVEGRPRGSVHVNLDYSRDSLSAQDQYNRTQPGIVGGAALGNLDNDPQDEIVVAGMDRHVYAFNHDGTPVPGFPVLVADPAKVAGVDPSSHKLTFVSGAGQTQGGPLIATPALSDFTGDGKDEIVVGAQESYQEDPNVADISTVNAILPSLGISGNARLYMISPLGNNASGADTNPSHPSEQAYLPGWPVKIAQLLLNVLPTIGDGVANQVAIADVNPAAGKEIIAQTAGGPTYVLKADGSSAFGSSGGRLIPAVWASGLFHEFDSRFGSNRNSNDTVIAAAAFSGPAAGKLDGDGTPDFATTTAGLSRLADLSLPASQVPNDDQLMAYSGSNGNALSGFPQATSDLAFFVTPAIGDVNGNGKNEVIAGNGVYLLQAHEADGTRPGKWPKLTGGWLVGTPAIGDFDGDGRSEIAVVRRDGVLIVWKTLDLTSKTQWPRFGGNSRNTGEYTG